MINVILVRTKFSQNIGAAARAMANMGADRLILVEPRTSLNSKARQGAAGAQQKLRECHSYASWDDFYSNEGLGLRIALTRRTGRHRDVRPLEKVLATEIKNQPLPGPIYLIFGPEEDGLSGEDLEHTNYACHLPVFGEFSSLNLAQAVLLGLFVCRQQISSNVVCNPELKPFSFPDHLLQDWVTCLGFEINDRRPSAYTVLKRLFLQNLWQPEDMNILESVLYQNVRKLKEYNKTNQANKG